MTTTTDTKYNGWTNYATWRIALEIFDGYDPDGAAVTAEGLEEEAGYFIFGDDPRTLVHDYANAFISDVNWYEIAEHINEDHELNQ